MLLKVRVETDQKEISCLGLGGVNRETVHKKTGGGHQNGKKKK